MKQQCYAQNISLGRPAITQHKSVTELRKCNGITFDRVYFMFITADRIKDIAKCSNFIECFEFVQIQKDLSSVQMDSIHIILNFLIRT